MAEPATEPMSPETQTSERALAQIRDDQRRAARILLGLEPTPTPSTGWTT